MRKLLMAAATIALVPFAAQAADYGPARAAAFEANSAAQCAFVRFDVSGSDWGWYAVSKSDPMYDSIYGVLFAAASTGLTVVWDTNWDTVCGCYKIKKVRIGQ